MFVVYPFLGIFARDHDVIKPSLYLYFVDKINFEKKFTFSLYITIFIIQYL